MVFTDKIEELITPSIVALGYEIWGIEYISAGQHSVLRVYLEKPGGIVVNDCAVASRQISAVLNVEEDIDNAFSLEVSSPGMERQLFKLEQYSLYLNKTIQLKTFSPVLGRRKFTGRLKEVINDVIIIEVDNELYDIPFNTVDRANLVLNF